MKKIIRGKVYDTDTAREVGSWSSDHYANDFAWYAETLYQKKTGEYFLHGEGNAASPYRQRCYDMWAAGDQLVPFGYDEARKWAEEHLEADEYIAEFGEPSEDEGTYAVRVDLSAAAKAKLDEMRSRDGITLAQAIERCVLG